MLLCFLYGMGSISDSEMAAEHYPSVYQAKQKGFLEEYQTFELHEVQRVLSFLKQLAFIRHSEGTTFIRHFEGTTYLRVEDVRK
jgi:hypothetical protein